MVEMSRVEKSGVEKFLVEMSVVEKFMVENPGVEKFLWTLVLKSSGLKLGVEKSGVEMSCNLSYNCPIVLY